MVRYREGLTGFVYMLYFQQESKSHKEAPPRMHAGRLHAWEIWAVFAKGVSPSSFSGKKLQLPQDAIQLPL
ncbi:MAG: hypothetical protein A3D67_00815 [Candidatus Lloydbacteria bacterium RIFCSPHIGHO2_02_FULL_51_22]|uniref:Uncharacterized protein n=2 Tax=Candidatus Lloydiibacteriota TaxID=1817910 RepID=A0A1G2DHB9_9BACT|nr:MAG: hypothetical protein A3D67_00815 [Candidatus Lloydbacteria bacterium RIFCSPHIGHO2_02_FULL_51_22]OGZ15295.1 MAG: hypothetical protein A3J08_00745 [Candidatus Lloydbacteria bacterium RIFCSPLOWO2_02_FULL_51_11]